MDRIVPFNEVKNDGFKSSTSQIMKWLIKKKKGKLKLWRRTGNAETGAELKSINKEIRRTIYDERRQAIRRQIRPANSRARLPKV